VKKWCHVILYSRFESIHLGFLTPDTPHPTRIPSNIYIFGVTLEKGFLAPSIPNMNDVLGCSDVVVIGRNAIGRKRQL
jgi:hypothetical protein